MPACTILILTYKGKHHLELLLPTVQDAIENYKGPFIIDVLIIDNGCDKGTRDFVRTHFPQFRYEFSPVNDYLFSLNPFIRSFAADYFLLLNDDLKLEKNILNELLPVIENDADIFAVTCHIMDFEGTATLSSVRTAKYSGGWLYNYYLDTTDAAMKYTLYPSGGASIFRTALFNRLNGFDTLYRPAYYEDTDLGIRAWQHGWKVVYNPRAIVFHREGGTINDYFKKNTIERNIFKNSVLWMIKNVHYPGFLFWFYLLLPYRLVINFFTNNNISIALLKAMKKLPEALSKRTRSGIIVEDTWWLKQLNLPYTKEAKNLKEPEFV